MNTENCSNCTCHHQQTCLAGVHPLHGDGYCHDELNNADCTYDGGDCCLSTLVSHHGDGYCHDELNNPECNYDNGDCCLYTVNKEHCSDCKCHLQQTCLAGVHPLYGDGYCHDELNNADCNYDSGDCCVNVNTDVCSECGCLEGGVITSPGFPGKYNNNLNLTWLIQAPIGQLIELSFLNFDVEFHSSCR